MFLSKDIIITQKDLIDALAKTEITGRKVKTNLPALRAAKNFLRNNSINLASLQIKPNGTLTNLNSQRQSETFASLKRTLIKPIIS